MKQGCQAVSIAMPSEMVVKLDRLPPYNRTTHVNRAVAAYLEIQGKPSNNAHGVDCDYFRRKLQLILRDLDSFTAEELGVEFGRMMGVLVDEHA
jgi:hypothetical protein